MTIQHPPRVRIAPSPTGPLHIGTARTGLFNFLFAKKLAGTFVLRIEDTDLERSEIRFENDIIEYLRWLGITWDEGPVRQTERLDHYEHYLRKLLHEDKAYYCFCSPEKLEIARQEMVGRGVAPKYAGTCSTLTSADVALRHKEGARSVIRFRMPSTILQFHDMIRGDVSFDTSLFGDIVISKDLRTPLYNFAVVVDDYEMQISHVIRGEDHVSNTPKQIVLQRALGFSTPLYAHLPLILDTNRAKLSKRFNAVSISDYKKTGYLPEALFNFIALLGWHPSEVGTTVNISRHTEIFSRNELIHAFDIERVQKAGAIFDIEKLDWLNAHYIKVCDEERLLALLSDFAPQAWRADPAKFRAVVALMRERMKRLDEFTEYARFFFEPIAYEPGILIWKKSDHDATKEHLRLLVSLLESLETTSFATPALLEARVMPFAEARGRGDVLWPMRVALSGVEKSPGPFEIATILGKEETIQRITHAIKVLENLSH
ncbi:MAG: glutamate--tRNA ligase [Patescibacteria group bacterium]|nr:glutamate--tRNA ligase [Patescibacteria group bacterium]MDE2437878.1 glutamate--tRNA ligase [Patescibacteria group bacterium]